MNGLASDGNLKAYISIIKRYMTSFTMVAAMKKLAKPLMLRVLAFPTDKNITKQIAVKAIENAGKVQMLTAKTENIKK